MCCAYFSGIEGEVINAGFGKGITIGELAQKILSSARLEKPVVDNSLPPGRMRLPLSNLCTITEPSKNGRATVALRAAALTIKYIEEHIQLYKADQYVV